MEYKIFIIYIAVFSIDLGDEIYFSKNAQTTHLKIDEAPTKVSSKYTNFINIFLPKLVAKLPKQELIIILSS